MTLPSDPVLIIDDEPDIRSLLNVTLSRMGLACEEAGTLEEARQQIADRTFSLCLTDMMLPDGNGLEIVAELGNDQPNLPVIVITAHGSIESATSALKSGAFDFVTKPLNVQDLRKLVQSALEGHEDTAQAANPEKLPRLLGDSAPMQHVRRTITKLARGRAPVLISGESGVGKELAAKLIHLKSSRANGPFVPVNCGAIPGELMESEFFGHKKGSFTGAVADHAGLFEEASGGTLFLDEIADLPLGMQVKLLRALQERRIRRIGENTEIPVDIRVVSASHKPLQELAENGDFRKDLYYRIAVIELRMPALRERPEDVIPLSMHILKSLCSRWNIHQPSIGKAARDALEAYEFPGNVRELENILERAVTLTDSDTIDVESLGLPTNSVATSDTPASHDIPTNLDDYLADVETDILRRALEESKFNKTAAARRLGISFRSLRYKLKKLGIED